MFVIYHFVTICNVQTIFTRFSSFLVDICETLPCKNGGTCQQTNHLSYVCQCPKKFFGINCTEVDYCHSNPCQNGGQCRAFGNAYQCSCITTQQFMYSGSNCHCKHHFFTLFPLIPLLITSNKLYIVTVSKPNPCFSNPCWNEGECRYIPRKINGKNYKCKCPRGFIGDICQTASRKTCCNIWNNFIRTFDSYVHRRREICKEILIIEKETSFRIDLLTINNFPDKFGWPSRQIRLTLKNPHKVIHLTQNQVPFEKTKNYQIYNMANGLSKIIWKGGHELVFDRYRSINVRN